MSVPIPLEGLRTALAERGETAYVLTVSEDGRPHAVHGRVRWAGDALATQVGRRSTANAAARPFVSLLYPGRTDGDYSLIVDGTATIAGDTLLVTPVKAVLHRPAPAPDPARAGCEADCVPLLSPTARPGSPS